MGNISMKYLLVIDNYGDKVVVRVNDDGFIDRAAYAEDVMYHESDLDHIENKFNSKDWDVDLLKLVKAREIDITKHLWWGKCKCGSNNVKVLETVYQEADASRGMNEIDGDVMGCEDCGRSWNE